MSRTPKVEGTKIAQAAKDLNVTSVTIRRYLTEFNIETTSDENGIKVLPDQAMEELKEIRKLKEDGLTNPKVLEILEELRSKPKEKSEPKSRAKAVKKAEPKAAKEKEAAKAPVVEEDDEEVEPEVEVEPAAQEAPAEETEGDSESGEGDLGDGRSKHSLTCQTCGKVFEHMNPRLRDCLDCYRAKRKERRRGGSDRHKNVIQHPLAQQAAKGNAAQAGNGDGEAIPQIQVREERAPRDRGERADRAERGDRGDRGGEREPREHRERADARAPRENREFAPQQQSAQPRIAAPGAVAPAAVQRTAVRNYRKAIEETRTITGSLKRRLERPDLPEGERRWLEQIYAYQLILHQGWRHLADYKAATQQQGLGKAPAAPASED
jgi:DNA-binding transcriptional MerR regulator